MCPVAANAILADATEREVLGNVTAFVRRSRADGCAQVVRYARQNDIGIRLREAINEQQRIKLLMQQRDCGDHRIRVAGRC
jgi:hypothetical protein